MSPVYLATTAAAPRIAERLPAVKLIAMLRHPIDRAWVRWVSRVRDGLERRTDFREIVWAEASAAPPRDDAFGTYLASGFLHHFLSAYFERFPRERIRIHLFEDLVRDPAALCADLFGFLGVPQPERGLHPERPGARGVDPIGEAADGAAPVSPRVEAARDTSSRKAP